MKRKLKNSDQISAVRASAHSGPHESADDAKVLGYGKDEFANLYIAFEVGLRTGRHLIAVSPRDIGQKTMFDRLNENYAHLISDSRKRIFMQQIDNVERSPRYTVITRLGWHGNAFVLPKKVISLKSKSKMIEHLQDLRTERVAKFRKHGTLGGWQKLAKIAEKNTRLRLALALAFVGPIGRLLQCEQVGIQLFGPPSTGKTALAVASGSVWGRHIDPTMSANMGFGTTWNATVNDLEGESLAANDTLLILDETKLINSNPAKVLQDLAATVMRWERGMMKGRRDDTEIRNAWWVALLSTSNSSLLEMAGAAQTAIDEALPSRLIDIPLPECGCGVYEDLCGERDIAALSQKIRGLAEKNFGVAARSFLRYLVTSQADNKKDLIAKLRRWHNDYVSRAEKNIQSTRDDRGRVHAKFATIYAAGRLAIEARVVRWASSKLRRALLQCEGDHFQYYEQAFRTNTRARIAAAPKPLRAPIEDLRQYLHEKTDDLADLTSPHALDQVRTEGANSIYVAKHKAGGIEYLFPDKVLAQAVGGSKRASELKRELVRIGAVATEKHGDGERFLVKRRVGLKQEGSPDRRYFVAIRAECLGEQAPQGHTEA